MTRSTRRTDLVDHASRGHGGAVRPVPACREYVGYVPAPTGTTTRSDSTRPRTSSWWAGSGAWDSRLPSSSDGTWRGASSRASWSRGVGPRWRGADAPPGRTDARGAVPRGGNGMVVIQGHGYSVMHPLTRLGRGLTAKPSSMWAEAVQPYTDPAFSNNFRKRRLRDWRPNHPGRAAD
ncbi:hypothetical protein THAOC_28956 [Thalassiosira oceanica]|uniref:Uncharacterized protein n=1 Tax=Thalassiosira oceanica TaxID=159749 RepID=K0RDN7_THAOC|nr:hypothetical protein THAOC_28956 [Thalassiosira oceanica]|eukprot:EJK51838.1 hypothetical protein THAOC_28956 [Thalassiosira oceanica]